MGAATLNVQNMSIFQINLGVIRKWSSEAALNF